MKRYIRVLGGNVAPGGNATYTVPTGSYLELRELTVDVGSGAAPSGRLEVIGIAVLWKGTGISTGVVTRAVMNTMVLAGETVRFANTSAAANLDITTTGVLVTP